MKKNRIEENKTDKHLAEKNQIEKNLIVDRLTVTYGEKLAVDGVSFSLSPGKIYVIVGESGSGKSTLLRTIGGLLTKEGKIVSGDIWMGEQNLIQLSEKEWCEVHGNKMGYIFQNPEQSLSPLAKIGKQFVECQNMHAKTAGKKSKKEILEDAEELLKELRFENPQRVLKSYPFELSGGMLLALRKKTDLSILLVTHNMEVARRLADEIGVMYQGRIIESGLPEEIWNDPKEDYTKKLIAAIPQPVKLVLDEG